DPLGVKPLWYSAHDQGIVFSSENKVIKGNELVPSNYIKYDCVQHNVHSCEHPKSIKKLSLDIEQVYTELYYAEQLHTKLIEAVKKRAVDDMGLLFSGGIDSFILAYICKQLGLHPTLYTAGTAISEDVAWAKKAADILELPLHIALLEDMSEQDIKTIVQCIESSSYVKVSVALPFFKALEGNTKKVILSGLG